MSYMVYQTTPFSMTLNDPKPIFQGQAILWRWISLKRLLIRPYGQLMSPKQRLYNGLAWQVNPCWHRNGLARPARTAYWLMAVMAGRRPSLPMASVAYRVGESMLARRTGQATWRTRWKQCPSHRHSLQGHKNETSSMSAGFSGTCHVVIVMPITVLQWLMMMTMIINGPK